MTRQAKTLFLVFIASAGLCLLWYKRVMIAISADERMLFIPFCGLGFLAMALLLDLGHLKRDNRSLILFCSLGSICFTALTLVSASFSPLLHALSLAACGCFAGGNFIVILITGMRLMPRRYRGRAFAFAFLFAGLCNTTTDIAELPFLRVAGAMPNLIMGCVCLALCLAVVWRFGQVFNLRVIPVASGEPSDASRMVRIGTLAVASFFLLYVSLSLKESVVYPVAVTELSTSGFIRYIELPLWLIVGFATDLLGRRVLISASLVAAFIGAAGALATDSPEVTALAVICICFLEIGFPTACCALLVDVSYYTRYSYIFGFLSFAPLVLGQLLEGMALPLLAGLPNDTLFLVDTGILVLFAILSVWLFSLVSASLSIFSATVDVIEFEGETTGVASPAQIATHYGLTRREQEILSLIIAGRTVRQMAAELYVSESTVKFHITNMLKKTASENRVAMLEKFGG